jgi:hypothetical protein
MVWPAHGRGSEGNRKHDISPSPAPRGASPVSPTCPWLTHNKLNLTRIWRLRVQGLDLAGGAPQDTPSSRTISSERFQYPDPVRAADVVVTKPGYGIISECIVNTRQLTPRAATFRNMTCWCGKCRSTSARNSLRRKISWQADGGRRSNDCWPHPGRP